MTTLDYEELITAVDTSTNPRSTVNQAAHRVAKKTAAAAAGTGSKGDAGAGSIVDAGGGDDGDGSLGGVGTAGSGWDDARPDGW